MLTRSDKIFWLHQSCNTPVMYFRLHSAQWPPENPSAFVLRKVVTMLLISNSKDTNAISVVSVAAFFPLSFSFFVGVRANKQKKYVTNHHCNTIRSMRATTRPTTGGPASRLSAKGKYLYHHFIMTFLHAVFLFSLLFFCFKPAASCQTCGLWSGEIPILLSSSFAHGDCFHSCLWLMGHLFPYGLRICVHWHAASDNSLSFGWTCVPPGPLLDPILFIVL